LSKLYERGGRYQKIADKVHQVIGKKSLFEDRDPIDELKVTNHGENRIKHCVKRDLGDGCRLITIVNSGMTVFCFAGTHDDGDKWLDRNRGLELAVNNRGQIEQLHTSSNITIEEERINTNPGLSSQPLIKKISTNHIDKISHGVKYSLLQQFAELKSTVTDDEIMELALEIESEETQNVFFDVFSKLREDDIEGAVKSIELYSKEINRIVDIKKINVEDLHLGDSFIDFKDLDTELLDHFVKTVNFKKWMLFMHPDQKDLVEKEFNGPAKLIGVSGSGKTAIVVKRAEYLANKYPREKILVLTLNKALASLINDLINEVCPDEERRNRIDVYSFWKLCQAKLKIYESGNEKLYDEQTWKTKEPVDLIWDEYFECKLNNDDAKVLNPINRSLLSRSVYPRDYIKQEYDWIRSACPSSDRLRYLDMERQGRAEPLIKEYRQRILNGLEAWENKMAFVGVTDYLGLSTALHKYIDKIKPEYRCVLVDEVQDFGTIELNIVRHLVPDNEKDNLFLCGDIAQQVCSKHHKMSVAGINVVGRSYSIKKNYRNSREILQASYCVLKNNVDIDNLKNDDFEIMEPEYANFSTPKPLLVRANSIDEEFGYCLNYLRNNLDSDKKACIAICGYSLLDVKAIGATLDIPVLDGETNVDKSQIFISDLEQTKGFEFDVVCILNCNRDIVPKSTLPKGEWYREISKFYVAMTRAKLSLIISYSSHISVILDNCRQYFVEAEWKEHEENSIVENFHLSTPMTNLNEKEENFISMTGPEFLFTRKAVGISPELYDKLSELINGRGATLNGRKTKWKDIGEAVKERDIPAIAQQFGAQKTWPEFKELFKEYYK